MALKLTVSKKSWCLLLLLTCVILVDCNTLFNNFVYDDKSQVLDNPWIINFKYLSDIFTHDATHAEMAGISNYYRPIMNLIYLLTFYLFGGLKPWAFHLVNVLLHAGNVMLVFATTSALFPDADSPGDGWLSVPFLSALLFAVHPANSEVVAWVACVPELMFTSFCLLVLYAHIRSKTAFDSWHFWSLGCFALALLSKETAVTVLPIIVGYDLIYRRTALRSARVLASYLSYLLVIAPYCALRFHALGGLAPAHRHPELSTFQVVLNVIPLFAQYLGKLLVPVNLNAFYILRPVYSVFELRFILSLAAVLLFAAGGYLCYRRNRVAAFGWIMLAVPIFPVLYIRGLGENTFADRYLYFPSIGYAIIVSSLLAGRGIRLPLPKKVVYAALAVIFPLYCVGSFQRNLVWGNEVRLWLDTVAKSPDHYLPQHNLGVALEREGYFADALPHLQQAIAMNPDYEPSYLAMAEAYVNLGMLDKAIEVLKDATLRHREFALCHNEAGCYLLTKGLVEEGIQESLTSLKYKPNFANAYINLGRGYAMRGEKEKGMRMCQEALRLAPDTPRIRNDVDFVIQHYLK